MTTAAENAERAASFLLARVRAARGRLWDQGASPPPPCPPPPDAPALAVFASRRVRGVSPVVAGGLLAWAAGRRPAELVFQVQPARQVLRGQAAGRRCVALVDDAAARAHGDPRHPDGLSFALHDLCHLEKFVDPAHHRGQVGLFRAVERALGSPALGALERTFDAAWIADRDYVIADMNGSAVFLFSVLKMRLGMAARRRLAAERGTPAPVAGPLDDAERAAMLPALDTLFGAMELPASLRVEALSVSARRDHPAHARRLLDYFESLGSAAPNAYQASIGQCTAAIPDLG